MKNFETLNISYISRKKDANSNDNNMSFIRVAVGLLCLFHFPPRSQEMSVEFPCQDITPEKSHFMKRSDSTPNTILKGQPLEMGSQGTPRRAPPNMSYNDLEV